MSGNPWFRVWPQTLDGSRPAAPSKTIAQVMRESSLPSKFVQMIPFGEIAIGVGLSRQLVVKFDSDLPYRMDGLVFEYREPHGVGAILPNPELHATVLVTLAGGRMLTQSALDPFAFNGDQGGKDFIPMRYRFQPNDLLQIDVRNIGAVDLTVRGFVIGYKLTSEDRT